MRHTFFSAPLSALWAGAVLSVAATGAIAQPTTPTTNPTTIGVTPQEAAQAERKAVQRSDTGTLVRTDESAADRARNAVDAAQADNPATRTTPSGSSMTDNTTAPATTMGSDTARPDNRTTRNTRTTQRRARADRN